MYTIIDIESNGAGYGEEKIIDIAILRYDGHRIIDQFMSLVNPQSTITPYVQKLTSIRPKMVKTAPKFHEIAKRIIEITEGSTLVGHNIDFDYRMLRQSFRKLGYDFKINTLDTIPLAKKLLPNQESYSLGKLAKAIGIGITDQHRASGDARATLELFKILIDKDTDNQIIQKQFEETNAKTYTNRVKTLTQDLPHERGIIYFQNKEGEILHTDFVSDINKAAKKVFNSQSKRWEKVQNTCEQLHYELSGHPIIAKLQMKVKDISKKQNLPYGLYHRNNAFSIEKTSLNKGTKPLIKFSSFTQGRKALSFIQENKTQYSAERLRAEFDLSRRTEIWTIKGRNRSEKAFIILEQGKITAFGFYEYFNQIQSLEKLNQLKIPVSISRRETDNLLKLSILQRDFKPSSIPL
mgnify:FL=1